MRRLTFLIAAALLILAPALSWAQGSGPIIRSATMQAAAAATGNGANLDTGQASVITLQTFGTFVGTVSYEVSNDGTNFSALSCYPLGTSPTVATTATAAAYVRCNAAATGVVRARISAYTSGAITVIGIASSLVDGLGLAIGN